MVITTATDNIMETQWVCRNCYVYFNGHEFSIDLIFLPLKKIDVILGMDRLSANSIYVSFKERDIFIPSKETTPMDVIGKLVEGMVNMIYYLFVQEKSYFWLSPWIQRIGQVCHKFQLCVNFPKSFLKMSFPFHQKGKWSFLSTLFQELL